ncbi:hypothetical protein [Chthonomonas calidirosea]|uniref:hypothetical protein n=1 Tax=Chthonomonas calidirosea TaxID=454171 RepID=UPI0003A33F76|nr:hypothetical protein [Chthonomonas calidirosea]
MLRGLPGVYVLVGELNDDVKGTGLTKESIQTALEQELRRVGIHVYDWDDPKQKQEIDDKNVPMLYTNVNSVRGDAPFDDSMPPILKYPVRRMFGQG